jgi:hypothetical protein
MATEYKCGQMELDTKATGFKVKLMDMERYIKQMVKSMKDSLHMINEMGRVL